MADTAWLATLAPGDRVIVVGCDSAYCPERIVTVERLSPAHILCRERGEMTRFRRDTGHETPRDRWRQRWLEPYHDERAHAIHLASAKHGLLKAFHAMRWTDMAQMDMAQCQALTQALRSLTEEKASHG